MTPDEAEKELLRIRGAIDDLDAVLVKLLNQRAKYALEIGEAKGALAAPVYDPSREKEVLDRVRRANLGPLRPEQLERLFERIIDEARRLEREACAEDGP